MALYHKYRPQAFAEVIGQDHVAEPLMQALRSGRLHHAYLFSGPRGCGKTTSARILAKSLNCAQGPTPTPCGECDSCVALAPGGPGSVDVIEIDAASHGGVDDARDLREKAQFAPIASRFKIYVIDEAHMVTTQGFNALLKLVEEPPEFITFIFATTEPDKVLPTIRSRTHHYPFRLVPPAVLRPYLEQLCQREGIAVEPAALPLVVRAGGGSVRDSLSVLDQLMAGAGEAGVTYARAVALLGVTDAALIDEITDALAAGDGAAAFATVDRVLGAGHDPRRFTSDLLERLRDLIILQRVPEAATNGMLDTPADQLERMRGQATRLGQATLSRLADIAHAGLTEMRGATAPRLLLELIVARMLLPGADESHGSLLQRLEQLEQRTAAGVIAAPSANPVAPPAAAPSRAPASSVAAPSAAVPSATRAESAVPAEPGRAAPEPARPPAEPARVATSAAAASAPVAAAPTPPPGGFDAAGVRRVWDEVLKEVSAQSKAAWILFSPAVVADVRGDEIVLGLPANKINGFAGKAEIVAEAFHRVLGGTWRVRAEVANGTPAGRSGAAPAGAAPAAARRPAGASGPAATAGPAASGAAARPAPTTQVAASTGDGDWPATAAPGGVAPQPPVAPPPADSGARPAGRGSARPTGSTSGGTEAGRGQAARAQPGRASAASVPPPDEPPFDPDYDTDAPPDYETDAMVEGDALSIADRAEATINKILGPDRMR